MIRTREKLLSRLTVTSEILRGSLVHRITRHSSGCAKCARGEGHLLWVLTVAYPGGRTRQFSLHQEQVPEVRRWLDNYQKLKQHLEAICELNRELLRADKDASRARRKSRD
jgi:cyclopropane fatty-acyl-phospholipid synthase-like methyltransferase